MVIIVLIPFKQQQQQQQQQQQTNEMKRKSTNKQTNKEANKLTELLMPQIRVLKRTTSEKITALWTTLTAWQVTRI